MLVVPGMLNELSADLAVSPATAGQLTTAFSLAVAIGAPFLAVATSRVDRRTLLVAALALCVLMHVASALASSFALLVVLRFVAGLTPAIVTPQGAASANLMTAPADRGKAMTTVFLGFSLASVAGMPLAALVAGQFGWRATMGIVALLALVAALWVRAVLPARLMVQPLGRAAWGEVLRNRRIMTLVALTVAQGGAQFVLFSYLAPVLRESIDAGPRMLGLLFAWFGACGVIGNAIGSRLIDRVGASRIQLVALAAMAAGFVLWPLTWGSVAFTAIALGLWGLGCFALNSAQQVRLVTVDARLAPASIAFNSSAIYLGQALGAVAGGAVMAHFGSDRLSWIGVAAFAIAFALWRAARRQAASR